MTGGIIAFAEQRDGQIKKTALEVVTAAYGLGRDLGAEVIALCTAAAPIESAGSLGRYGATEVLSGGGDLFKDNAPDTLAQAIATLAEERDARAILLPATTLGKDIAPRVAALLNIAQVSDCTGLFVDAGQIRAERPVYSGKAVWSVRSRSPRFLATLRPNVFTPKQTGGADLTPTPFTPKNPLPSRLTIKEVLQSEGVGKQDVTEATVIVAGGRGLKGPENYHLLEDLAATLGGTVGSSRAVVDAGWRPHGEQVGQTGKVVSPNLYIACGISGAIQHLAGMTSSRVIVAINKDPEAPIFKVADYGIVGDLMEIVPALNEELKRV